MYRYLQSIFYFIFAILFYFELPLSTASHHVCQLQGNSSVGKEFRCKLSRLSVRDSGASQPVCEAEIAKIRKQRFSSPSSIQYNHLHYSQANASEPKNTMPPFSIISAYLQASNPSSPAPVPAYAGTREFSSGIGQPSQHHGDIPCRYPSSSSHT